MRHGIVSCICGGSEFISFIILTKHFEANIYLSYVLSFALATVIGFVLHSVYTFSMGGLQKKSGILFLIQISIALFAGLFMFNLFYKYFKIDPIYAKALQLAFTFWINVIFGKKITFKKEIL
ncbi:hypothetical protein G6715_05050 [Polynucleobacter paneuropaeus]|nr:hypothetical protein [Polynucleobacter paneuropaeus]